MTTPNIGCFVAGTLIHTHEGLKPIEQIKVGDYVLSKSKSGLGEASYNSVLNTFAYEGREVYFVSWDIFDSALNQWVDEYVVVTGDHRFWIKRLTDQQDGSITEVAAWMAVEKLFRGADDRMRNEEREPLLAEVELQDGRVAQLGFTFPILRTAKPEVGLVFCDGGFWRDNWEGIAVDFSASSPLVEKNEGNLGGYKEVYMDLEPDDFEEYEENSVVFKSGGFHIARRRVYDIKVEGNAAYYVGKAGALVHHSGN